MSVSTPLNWREKKALNHFLKEGPSASPHGVAGGTIFNLLQRKLISQVTATDEGEPRYQITTAGFNAAQEISN